MPYNKFPSGNGWKVWKTNEQGEKIGEPLSKKVLSKQDAINQMKALYASENKKEVELTVTDADGGQETVTKPLTLDDNGSTETKDMGGMDMMESQSSYGPCSWEELDAAEHALETAEHMNDMTWKFRNMANAIINNPMVEDKAQALVDAANGYAERVKSPMEEKDLGAQIAGDNQKAQMGAAQINNLPDSDFLYIESGGKKDDSGKTVPRSLRHLPVHDEAHIRNAISRLSQSGTGMSGGDKWLTPALRKSLLAKARKMLEASKKEVPDFTIWKEGGIYRWLVAYSNNQRDNDIPAEIITSESHKEFDLALHNKEWPMPELWLWHIPYPVGQTDYHAYDESTGYPVAAGHFKEGMEWAAEGLIKEKWNGVSHGMPDRWIQRDKEDSSLIVRHRTKEISFLPNWAAANKNTFSIISKESSMADIEKGLPAHKRPEFVAAFGEEKVKQIEEALQSKAKEADEQGVEKKEAKEPTMADVVKALEFLTTELVTLKKQIEKPVEKEAEEFDLVARLKSLSAVGQESTKVDGRTALAKSGPEETKQEAKADPITGLSVPLVEKIFQSNQAYYNGGAK